MKHLLFFLILTGNIASLAAQKGNVLFTDVAAKSGLNFKYTFGDFHYENILESSGSGITIFDYNNDMLMDILMLNGTYIEGISDEGGKKFKNSIDRLYRNNGNGTFTDVTSESGLVDFNWSMAASAIDFDNDGDQDLFLLNYGPNVFYRNNGNGTFTDITDKLKLRGPEKLNGFTKWSIGASFMDVNHDGRMDVMVGNFLAFDPKYISTQTPGFMPHPSEYKGQASILYEQQADGSFKDVTMKYKLFYPDSKCMGLTVFDYDNDGDADIFQANDHHFNYMFRNEKGVYNEVGVAIGVAANSKGVGTGSMHGTIGDVDGDGFIDILVTDLAYGALYRNLGNGLFNDITESSGVAKALTGKGAWASALFDFDNDGDLDIISANGTAEELVLQLPVLLENDGKGHFRNTGTEYGAYFGIKRSGRGLVTCDYDNDGDMDVAISHVDLKATASLLKNECNNGNHWLGITLLGKNGSQSAIAARVTVTAGGKKQVLINQWSTSYLSNNDQRLHAGLGKSVKVDEIEVRWTGGKTEIYRNIPVDSYVVIKEGMGLVENSKQ